MPFAFVNALLRAALADTDAMATNSADNGDAESPYVAAVRDALRRGGCNASRSSLAGACVAASTVSCDRNSTTVDSSAGAAALTIGGVPVSWVERVWCAGHMLPLIGELGRVRSEIQRSSATLSSSKL